MEPMEQIKNMKEMTLNEILESGCKEAKPEEAMPFMQLMMQYKCALMEVETKLKVLNAEFALKNNRNPFEAIKSRIKSPESILEKLERKGLPISVEAIEQNIMDIAGIRVICSFTDDIYTIAGLLVEQDDVWILKMKDYIEDPKPNGYRSLHLIVEIPIFLSEKKKWMKVEVQFRTIAMDFWASLEHKLKYKKNISNSETVMEELKECAEASAALDLKMQKIRDQIEVMQE